MDLILSLLLPALLLAYYLQKLEAPRRDHPLLLVALVGGTCLYWIGLLFSHSDRGLQTLLQLSGACLFFTGVAFHSLRRPQVNQAVTPPEPPEDIDPGLPD